jgi:hypothetical protein
MKTAIAISSKIKYKIIKILYDKKKNISGYVMQNEDTEPFTVEIKDFYLFKFEK